MKKEEKMSMCKAICADCRYKRREMKQWRCYYQTEPFTDCVTGEVTYSSGNCCEINLHGECEDFEVLPPKPKKDWWVGNSWRWEWDVITQRYEQVYRYEWGCDYD